MGELGDARALKLLIPLLAHADLDTRKAAIYALFRFQSPEAVNQLKLYQNEILPSLKDSDPFMRKLAIEVLGKIPGGLKNQQLILFAA